MSVFVRLCYETGTHLTLELFAQWPLLPLVTNFLEVTLNVDLCALRETSLGLSQHFPSELKNMLFFFYDCRNKDFPSHNVFRTQYNLYGIFWQTNNQQRLLDPEMDHYSHRDWFTAQDASQSPGYERLPALMAFILQLYEALCLCHNALENLRRKPTTRSVWGGGGRKLSEERENFMSFRGQARLINSWCLTV